MTCLCPGEKLPAVQIVAELKKRDVRVANLAHLSLVAPQNLEALLERKCDYAYPRPYMMLNKCQTPLPTVYSDASTNSELLYCVENLEVPEHCCQPAHMRTTSLCLRQCTGWA